MKSHLHFHQGDTLPAGKHNGLVADAQAVADALGHEHGGDGAHAELRFERCWGVAEWNAFSQQWVGVQEDRLAVVHQLGERTFLHVRLTIVEGQLTPEEMVPLLGPDSVGVIAVDQLSRPVPIVEQRYAGAQDQGIWIVMRPFSNSTRVSVLIVGVLRAE